MSNDSYREDYASAMRSYNAMETTKRRHFDYMTVLDSKKKKFNLEATSTEIDRLEMFLRDHHEEVQTFKARCEALKIANSKAHQAMFEYIGKLNRTEMSAGEIVSH